MPQSLAKVPIHLVFSTKLRTPNIDEAIQAKLFSYLSGILRGEGHVPMIVGGHLDHVHLLFALARTKSISNTVERLKVSSSIWLKGQEGAYQNFSWQNGYGAFGVSISETPAISAYIQNQAEHHKVVSFQEEFRALLREHDVEYDERYVWD